MNILDKILAQTQADLSASKKRMPLPRLQIHAEKMSATKDFTGALKGGTKQHPRIIAELKKASPSRGLIRQDFGIMSLSRELVQGGAAALSVLTEVHYFLGNPRYLQAVAADSPIPVLRKDFIVDEYQIYEARTWGADAVLLIAAILDPATFSALYRCAAALGLSVLAEVHNDAELEWVVDAGAEIIGVNSRNLKTFKTSLDDTMHLIQKIPSDRVIVAESGIRCRQDLQILQDAGADAFLIGEALMCAPSPAEKLAELMGRLPLELQPEVK